MSNPFAVSSFFRPIEPDQTTVIQMSPLSRRALSSASSRLSSASSRTREDPSLRRKRVSISLNNLPTPHPHSATATSCFTAGTGWLSFEHPSLEEQKQMKQAESSLFGASFEVSDLLFQLDTLEMESKLAQIDPAQHPAPKKLQKTVVQFHMQRVALEVKEIGRMQKQIAPGALDYRATEKRAKDFRENPHSPPLLFTNDQTNLYHHPNCKALPEISFPIGSQSASDMFTNLLISLRQHYINSRKDRVAYLININEKDLGLFFTEGQIELFNPESSATALERNSYCTPDIYLDIHQVHCKLMEWNENAPLTRLNATPLIKIQKIEKHTITVLTRVLPGLSRLAPPFSAEDQLLLRSVFETIPLLHPFYHSWATDLPVENPENKTVFHLLAELCLQGLETAIHSSRESDIGFYLNKIEKITLNNENLCLILFGYLQSIVTSKRNQHRSPERLATLAPTDPERLIHCIRYALTEWIQYTHPQDIERDVQQILSNRNSQVLNEDLEAILPIDRFQHHSHPRSVQIELLSTLSGYISSIHKQERYMLPNAIESPNFYANLINNPRFNGQLPECLFKNRFPEGDRINFFSGSGDKFHTPVDGLKIAAIAMCRAHLRLSPT